MSNITIIAVIVTVKILVISMSNYIYYVIRHNKATEVELKCCIDLDTIDDDEPDCEYVGNDGVWNTQRPMFCKIDGKSFDFELNQLCEVESMEWDVISQILAECEDTVDEVFKRDFGVASLYVSYDIGFSSKMMKTYPLGRIVENDYS